MNSELHLEPSLLEERTDILFREIELAARWERPSILFAIYRSDTIRDQVMAELECKLGAIGQQVQMLAPADQDQFGSLQELINQYPSSQTILFLDGFKHEEHHDGSRIFEQINKYREYFIDNSLRAVFWLFDQDVRKFAARATECWYLRHRVIDFTDEIDPARLFLDTLESCTQSRETGAAQCADAEKIEQEIEKLNQELSLHPSQASVLYLLGLLWSKKNDQHNAQKFIQAALEIATTTGDTRLQGYCWQALAQVQVRLGNPAEAVTLFKKAAHLHPKPGPIWKNIGLLLAGSQDNQQKVEAFLNALRTLPQDQTSWVHLGNTYLDLGLVDKAGPAFETALELDPASYLAWLGLGKTFLQKGEIDQAVTALQKAVQLDGSDLQAWLNLGQGFYEQNRELDALLAYQKAAEIDPGNVKIWNQLGSIYIHQQKYDQAIKALEKAQQLDPESGECLKNLGIAEFHSGNYPRAAQYFEQAIPLFDDRGERALLWKHLADTCVKMNNDQMAVSALKQAVRLVQPLTSSRSGNSLEDDLQTEQGLNEHGGNSMMESQNTFESRSAREWSDLGNSYLKAGAYHKAVFAYTRAIEMAPENSWPYIKNLAVANYQMGKRLGKNQAHQPENPDLWEPDEEDLEIPVSDDLPQPQRSEPSPGSDLQAGLQPVTEPAPPPQPLGPAPSQVNVSSLGEIPPSAEDLNEWGNNYAAAGDFDRAIEAYKKAIQTDPGYGQPYSNLGLLYFKKGDYRLAAVLYQKGIKFLTTVEDKADTLNRLGDTLHRLHKYEDAFIAYKRARELAPSKNPLMDRARISILQNSLG